MERVLRKLMSNCIQIVPIIGEKINLSRYTKSVIRDLPLPEMDAFIREQVKYKSHGQICVAIVIINAEATIYSRSTDSYSRAPILFNAEYVGKSRQILDTRTDGLITEIENYGGEYDFAAHSGYRTEYGAYPGLEERHQQAVASGENEIDLDWMDSDDTVEVLDTFYYKQLEGAVATIYI